MRKVMSRKRLSSKHVKQDKFVQQTFDWMHWAETHRSQVVGAVVGIALLVVAFFVYQNVSGRNEETASREYILSRQAYMSGNYQLATSDLEDFLRRHGGTSYGDDAQFFLADGYYQSGRWQEAVSSARVLLNEHRDSPFVGAAWSVIGASSLRLEDYDGAIAAYQSALDVATYDARRVEVLESLGRAYEARGDSEAAVEQYRAILELEDEGGTALKARRRIAELTVEPLAATGVSESGPAAE